MVSGDLTVTDDLLGQFCDSLGISLRDFYFSYQTEDRNDYLKVYELYTLIQEKKFDKLYMIVNAFDRQTILSKQYQRFFDYCKVKADYLNKKMGPFEVVDTLCDIIDYPDCLERTAFDFVDVLAMTLIAEVETNLNKEKAIHKLLEILKSSDILYVSYELKHILAPTYANVVLFLSRLRQFEYAADLALEGIETAQKFDDMTSVAMLRYIRSYSLLQLGFQPEAEMEAARCLMTLIAKNDVLELQKYYEIITKDFDQDPYDFISKYNEEILI